MTSSVPQIFCKRSLKKLLQKSRPLLNPNDPLLLAIENCLLARLSDFNKTFSEVLTLGFRSTALSSFCSTLPQTTRLVRAMPLVNFNSPPLGVVVDEEYLPFASQKFDIILSALHLHNVNDLPGALCQLYQTLKQDGVFIAALFGGYSLNELHQAFFDAELSLKNGVSPRFSPMIDMKDAAQLLRRSGFSNSISESLSYTLSYEDPLSLMNHLKSLAETNILTLRPKGMTSSKLFKKTFELYETRHPDFSLTFEVLFLTGWRLS